MSELNDKIDRTDTILRWLGITTSVMLLMFSIVTFIYVARINSNLQTQVKQHRSETENTIEAVHKENEESHAKHLHFIQCLLRQLPGERDDASVNACLVESEKASSTNNTPVTESQQPEILQGVKDDRTE